MDLKDYEKKYNIGQSIFKSIASLSDKDLKEKLLYILEDEDENIKEIINESVHCTRVIKNEEPEKIEFSFYSGIRVDWSGITVIPEHGSAFNILKFNKNFKL